MENDPKLDQGPDQGDFDQSDDEILEGIDDLDLELTDFADDTSLEDEEILELTETVDVPVDTPEATPKDTTDEPTRTADVSMTAFPSDDAAAALDPENKADALDAYGDTDDVLEDLLSEADASATDSDTETDFEHEVESDIIDRLGMELDAEVDLDDDTTATFIQAAASIPASESSPQVPVTLTDGSLSSIAQEQIDAAVERVIKNMFSEKIEKMIVTALEKAVKEEIHNVKNLLLEELSDE